jgi:hypothetical protein
MMVVVPPPPPSLPPGRVTVFLLGVVLVMTLRPVIYVVPAQHLPAEVDEDLVHIHCNTSA